MASTEQSGDEAMYKAAGRRARSRPGESGGPNGEAGRYRIGIRLYSEKPDCTYIRAEGQFEGVRSYGGARMFV